MKGVKVTHFLCLACLLLSAIYANAQSSPALHYGLKDCIANALENNYQIQITRNQEQTAHNNATLANAGGMPTIEASVGLRPNLTNVEHATSRATGEVTRNYNTLDVSADANVSLNWTIFDGFKIQTNYKQLQLLEMQGETATRMAVEDLVADIATEYYNYIQQIIRQQNYLYAMELSRERLRIAELNYQTGRFSGLDYHQARVDYHSDSASYVRQREAVMTTCIHLNRLMANEKLDQLILLPDSSIQIREDLSLSSLWQQTLASNAELLNAAQNTMLAELDQKKVMARNYPYLRLNAQYGYNYGHYGISATRDRGNLGLSGGLSVGFNIFDGKRKSDRQNAELAVKNRQLQRKQLELDLHASLTTFWQAYQNNLELLSLQRENLKIAQDNLEAAMDRYKLGNLSGFDMRQVQKNLLDAEEHVLQAQYDAKICEISLLLISGDISWYMK